MRPVSPLTDDLMTISRNTVSYAPEAKRSPRSIAGASSRTQDSLGIGATGSANRSYRDASSVCDAAANCMNGCGYRPIRNVMIKLIARTQRMPAGTGTGTAGSVAGVKNM